MAIWSRNPSKRPATDEPPTRIIGENTPASKTEDVVPPVIVSTGPFGAIDVSDEPETMDMAAEDLPARARRKTDTAAEPETKIVGSSAEDADQSDLIEDPPVGFLIIIDGPGKGNHIAFGYGVNTIGRGANQRIQLDFGDANISRDNHAQIVFDPQTRKTLLRHEQGANLTYARGEAVLSPIALEPRETFQIADTVLMVLPLCDTGWDWSDLG